jgi:CRP-like cAMP-binding protein
MMSGSEQSPQLKTGLRPTQLIVKSFKPGETVFEENSRGRELFVIQEGCVGIYKTGTDGDVELARLQKGAVIGEMSLLDNMPRSATVKAVELTKLLVVNELTFQTALKEIPVWITSIIRIVVSRLRDANKRVDQAVLRDKERGFVSLMLLLLPSLKHEFESGIALDYALLFTEAYYVCRLKKNEISKPLSNLEQRKIVSVVEDALHAKHVCIVDIEVLRLYEEYLSLRGQKKSFKETNIPDESIALFGNIAYIAQKSGIETNDGTTLHKSALQSDLEEKRSDNLEKNLLDLKRRNLISVFPSDNDDIILFKKETLLRIKKIKEWLPRFEMEIAQ